MSSSQRLRERDREREGGREGGRAKALAKAYLELREAVLVDVGEHVAEVVQLQALRPMIKFWVQEFWRWRAGFRV